MALAALAGAANAQSVQFEFYERTNQSVASAVDPVLEIGVRARAIGTNLGGFNFNIITDDAESNGTMLRGKISTGAIPNTYSTAQWATTNTGNTVSVHGVAGSYSYLAGINPNFNGLINVSGGTFTNNPAVNEIGLVAGAATGGALTSTPFIDEDGDGIPDLAPSNGNPSGSTNNEVAPLDPRASSPYFAAGQFIDLYRFRYTVSNFAIRDVHFSLGDLGAQFFSQLLYNNGAWGAQNTTADGSSISATGFTVHILPTPASVALMGLGGLMVARRRRA